MLIGSNREALAALFKSVMDEIKGDWTKNYVVYPFLPNQEMAQFM